MLVQPHLCVQKARAEWGKTPWNDLVPDTLLEGIEVHIKNYRRLPREIRQYEFAIGVEMALKDFKSTIPLMVDLKNEALRDRHWNQLMEKSGTFSSSGQLVVSGQLWQFKLCFGLETIKQSSN